MGIAVPYGVTTTDPLNLSGYIMIKYEPKPKVPSKQERLVGGDGKVIQESSLDLRDEFTATYIPTTTPAGAHGLVKHAKSGDWIIDEVSQPEDAEGRQTLVVSAHKNLRTHVHLDCTPAT